MYAAYTEQRVIIGSWEASKEDAPFFCIGCHSRAILKKGPEKYPHFAHVSLTNCSYGRGESVRHWKAKFAMRDALEQDSRVNDVQVERAIGKGFGDVSFHDTEHNKVDSEMQMSTIPTDLISQRTQLYNSEDFAVLWLLDPSNLLSGRERYPARRMEKYLHALYFGRVYYWLGGQKILVVEFHECQPEGFFNRFHRAWDGGNGYIYSRYVTAWVRGELNIADLQVVTRKPENVGRFSLPAAQLWCLPEDSERSQELKRLYKHW